MNILLKSYSTLKSKKKKGFTLIELVVVIAIMAILALLLVPNLTAYIKKADETKIQANMKNIHTAAELVNQTEGDLILDDIVLFSNAESGTVEIGSEFVDKTYTVSKNSDTGQITIRYRSDKSGDHIFPDNGGSLVNESGIDEPGNGEPGIDESGIDSLIAEGYIPVATAEDLNSVRSTNSRLYAAGTKWEKEAKGGLNKKYVQVANIDLSEYSEEGWTPIGTSSTKFTGTYDGGSYVITDLEVKGEGKNHQGLFGYTSEATIENVALENINVAGSSYVGGLVGHGGSTKISNSYATGTVTGRARVGGLVGQALSNTIENSYATGSVKGTNYVGGLVGSASKSTIENSYATGSITGETDVGGLVGSTNENTTISNSYAIGSVTGTGNSIGGLVGHAANRITISNSYATGSATGDRWVGGLVGRVIYGASAIENSYATGSVTGAIHYTGGLVGMAPSTYPNATTVTVKNSYWDSETTGLDDLSGRWGMGLTGGTGLTTDEMKDKETYSGWDFTSIWEMNEGTSYPTLR